MIKEIIEKWESNKSKLESYFATNKQEEYSSSYEKILKKVFEIVINTESESYLNFAIDKMTIVDDGHYQGTQIFLIPKETYQPSASDYLVTDTSYGSCSGCDTLQCISGYSDDFPTPEQVKDYMMLSLHLIQKLKWLSEN